MTRSKVRITVDLDRELYFSLHGVLQLRRQTKAGFFRQMAEREIRAAKRLAVNPEALDDCSKPRK